MEQGPAASAFDESPPVPEQSSDWDDDDGWAADHSQPATVAAAPAEDFQSAPAAADVFGTAPAVDTAAFPATGQHPGEGDSGETPDEYGTDDRSSVLKFLRRD